MADTAKSEEPIIKITLCSARAESKRFSHFSSRLHGRDCFAHPSQRRQKVLAPFPSHLPAAVGAGGVGWVASGSGCRVSPRPVQGAAATSAGSPGSRGDAADSQAPPDGTVSRNGFVRQYLYRHSPRNRLRHWGGWKRETGPLAGSSPGLSTRLHARPWDGADQSWVQRTHTLAALFSSRP